MTPAPGQLLLFVDQFSGTRERKNGKTRFDEVMELAAAANFHTLNL